MIKIRHRQTGGEKTYNAKIFYQHKIDLAIYEIVSWEDVVELFDKFGSHGKMERFSATKIINENSAQSGYRMVDVLRPDLREFALKKINEVERHKNGAHLTGDRRFPIEIPTNTPMVYTINKITLVIKNSLSILKNDYVKYIIIGVSVLLIWFLLYPVLKVRFGHS